MSADDISDSTIDEESEILIKYLNSTKIKIVLGIPNEINWDGTSIAVNDALMDDIMKNDAFYILPQLLQNTNFRFLLWVGNRDGSECGVLGQEAVLKKLLEITPNPNFELKNSRIWNIPQDSKINLAGWITQSLNFQWNFVVMHRASHYATMEKPIVGIRMIHNFIENIPMNNWSTKSSKVQFKKFGF